MKRKFLTKILIILTICLFSINAFGERTVTNFNKNWKFILEDNDEFATSDYNDSSWQTLNVPHDWAFENGIHKDGKQGQGGGYHDGGIGWYRKTFQIDEKSLSKTIYIDFDGVYMNSEVFINGISVGKGPYGYISFRYEISDLLKTGFL